MIPYNSQWSSLLSFNQIAYKYIIPWIFVNLLLKLKSLKILNSLVLNENFFKKYLIFYWLNKHPVSFLFTNCIIFRLLSSAIFGSSSLSSSYSTFLYSSSLLFFKTLFFSSSFGTLNTYDGWTHKFIFPPFEFSIANSMISNFHTPKSTLLMMVSAFGGKDFVMKAYKEAMKKKYNFSSYGDAMMII